MEKSEENAQEDRAIKTQMTIQNLMGLAQIILLIVIIVLISKGTHESNNEARPILSQSANQPNKSHKIVDPLTDLNSNQVIGDANASISLAVFSNYDCVYCKKFTEEILPKLEADYIQKKLLKLVFFDVPDIKNERSMKISEACECANAQGKFIEMHREVFRRSEDVSFNDDFGFVSDIGLDSAAFYNCLNSNFSSPAVLDDLAIAEKIGVSATPCFVVNNKMFTGLMSYNKFQNILENELEKLSIP